LLLIGGQESSPYALELTEVWELTLGSPPRWSLLAPGGVAPRSRNGMLAAYDAVHDRVVMFGGEDNASAEMLSETWVLDLSSMAWSQLETAGVSPPSLSFAGGGYDAVRNRLVVFGGYNGPLSPSLIERRRELWTLSLAGTPTWSLASPSGSPPVTPQFGAMSWSACDRATDAIYFECELGFFRLRLAGDGAWEKIDSTSTTPIFDRNRAATLAIDARRGRLMRVGGSRPDVSQGSPITDETLTYELDLSTDQWSELFASGSFPPPPAYGYATGGYDSKRRLIELPPDGSRVWELDLAEHEWSTRPVLPPTSLYGSTIALYDSVGDRTLILCTACDSIRAWTMSPGPIATLSPLLFSNAAPSPRGNPAWVLDPARRRLLLFGGALGSSAFGDLWSLSLDASPTWALLSETGPPRQSAMVGVDPLRSRLYVVGGATAAAFPGAPQILSDAWSWPLDTGVGWTSEPNLTLPLKGTSQSGLQFDGRRNRFLLPINRSPDVAELSLSLDPAPHWDAPMVHPGQALGPVFLDRSIDRLLLPMDHLGVDLGTVPFAPVLACPSNERIVPGSIASLPWAVVDTAGIPDSLVFEMNCSRAWPGFPIRGLLSRGKSGFVPRYPGLGIPVPDSASLGPVSFAFTTSGAGIPGLDASCDAFLDVVGPPIYAGQARTAPDHVWLEWQASQSGLTLDIQRRASLGEWESVAGRTSVAGPFRYDDGSVEAGKHYDYRIVVIDPHWHGDFGFVPVDVPNLELAFAPDQQNPLVGRSSVSFYVTPGAEALVETFDIRGRRVASVQSPAGNGGRVSVDFAAGATLPSGVYFVHVGQAGHLVSQKFVFLR
jgi:hypothetical protein